MYTFGSFVKAERHPSWHTMILGLVSTRIKTFAPVVKMDSIYLVWAISASKHWEVYHMDVKSAFLHGDIHEEIYMIHLWLAS